MLGRKELERSFSRKNGDFTSITKSLIKDMIEDKGLTSLELQSYFMNLEWYMGTSDNLIFWGAHWIFHFTPLFILDSWVFPVCIALDSH